MNISVSVMVPTPWFAEAVEILKNKPKNVAIGVHLTANSEWALIRWRPLSDVEDIPTLIDQDGYFRHEYIGSWEPQANITELEREFRAQIKTAIDAGLQLSYIDGHMGAED